AAESNIKIIAVLALLVADERDALAHCFERGFAFALVINIDVEARIRQVLADAFGMADVGEILIGDRESVASVFDPGVVELISEFRNGSSTEPDLGHLEVPDRLGFETVLGCRHRAVVAHCPHPPSISGNWSGSWP